MFHVCSEMALDALLSTTSDLFTTEFMGHSCDDMRYCILYTEHLARIQNTFDTLRGLTLQLEAK